MPPPEVVFGTGVFGVFKGSNYDTPEKVQASLDFLQNHSITRLDSARTYPNQNPGTAEAVLGQTNLHPFSIDTKVWSKPGQHTPAWLQKSIDESLQLLGLAKVNTLYLHMPDPNTPLEDVCRGINDIHLQNKFVKFGISNFTIPQIKQMLQICDANNYVKPTVYQGQYSAIARDAENELMPLLRDNGMAFYAYSPAAGGAFNSGSTRMAAEGMVGDLARAWYGGAAEPVAKVCDAASRAGLTGHAVALRWVLHHSALDAEHGDAMIIGARTLEQLKATLHACEAGPLPEEMVGLMGEVWEAAKGTAPLYSMFAVKEGETENVMDKVLKK